MKTLKLSSFFLLLSILFSSCDLIGGIFKAGVWSGIIIVIAIIALLFWLITRAGRR